jgi:multidrug efflux pump subunit AcrA (membrane-fusion protein)
MKVSFIKKDKDPTVVHGMKVNYAPAKRRVAKLRWYIILLLVASPLIYFLIKLAMAWMIVGAPGYVTLEQVAINSQAEGVVERIPVAIGQMLAPGETIARLYNPDLASQMMLRKAELDAIQPAGIVYGAGQGSYFKSRMSLAEENLGVASHYLKNVEFLFSQGAATMAELNLARERRNRTQIEYDQALFDYNRFRITPVSSAAPTAAEVASMRLRIEAQIAALERDQERLIQRTVYAGRVLDILAREGESLSNGAPILLLGRAKTPYVEAYLPPRYAEYAQKGAAAVVKLSDGTRLSAVVREDASLARRLPSDLTSPIGSRDMMLMVRLDLQDPLPDIQWVHGLPVSVRFRLRLLNTLGL